jgi:beta-fructofuranosidase
MRQHQQAIAKAEQAIRLCLDNLEQDGHRPVFHAVPRVNWMNDPNGLIYYHEAYHLFYQHNPFSPQWGNIHWGHMRSRNLIHWEHLPIALAPSEAYDRDGCFSGCAVEHDGRLYLFYTANIFTSPQGLPDDLLQQQCLAVSEDGGLTFRKYEGNPIISSPPEGIGDNNHFRDPKVWRHEGQWYMVLGTKKQGRGKVLLYRSENLLDWTYVSVLVESDGSMGHMFECPDLFTIDGCDILVVSPEGMKDHPVSGYFAGKLDYATGRYEHEGFHLLDHGHHFYAPQTFQGPDGRRILIAWMPMKGSELGKSWSGSMTFPRELTLGSDRRLRFKPVDEIARLRQRATRQPPAPFRLEEGSLELGQGTELELIVTFNLRDMTAAQAGIRFFASSREEAILGYEAGTNALFVDYGHLSASPCERKSVSLGNGRPEELKLRLLLDHSAVEVFVNEGELAFSTLLFPGPDSRELSLFARGGCVDVEQLELYRLGQDL